MVNLSSRPGDFRRYPTGTLLRHIQCHHNSVSPSHPVNPYAPNTTSNASERLSRLLYVPALFCWFGSLAYFVLFCIHAWTSFQMPWEFEGKRAFRIVVFVYAAIGTVLLVCTLLSCWLGFRTVKGKWKSSVLILLLSFGVFMATLWASFTYLDRIANS